jgi:CRP-like cAMP-binding protein
MFFNEHTSPSPSVQLHLATTYTFPTSKNYTFHWPFFHSATPFYHHAIGYLSVTLSTNGLIFQLAKEDQKQLQSICQPVALKAGQALGHSSLHDSPKVYFLTGASVALLVKSPEQHTLAVGLVGQEGAVGLGALLSSASGPLHYRVQTGGHAWCANSKELALLLHQRPGMLWTVSQYLWQLAEHVATMSGSIQFDAIDTRLAHWLVLSSERAQSTRLPLTHEHLAQMLGVRRVSITLAAGALKERGLIDYQRGVVNILNLAGLCEVARPQQPPPVTLQV